MTRDELSRGHVRPLPKSMGAALDQLQQDGVLLGSMDELLARCYLAVRRSEVEEFSVQDQEFEIRHHFYRF
jgi:glutamine synthetase